MTDSEIPNQSDESADAPAASTAPTDDSVTPVEAASTAASEGSDVEPVPTPDAPIEELAPIGEEALDPFGRAEDTADASTEESVDAPEAAESADVPEEESAAEVAAEVPRPDDSSPDESGSADSGSADSGSAEAVAAEDLVEEAPAEPAIIPPYKRPGKWFVLHTQSGYENKVKQNLEARTQSMNMESRILEIVIPMEDQVDLKDGKEVVVKKKMFPGYLLVRCKLDDDSWYVIRNTPGVTGFVGAGNKPSALPKKEVEKFLTVKPDQTDGPTKTFRPRLQFEMNETVRVKEGPFADFSGEIVEINEDQLKLKVLVDIFGRETPVELEFSQVAKL